MAQTILPSLLSAGITRHIGLEFPMTPLKYKQFFKIAKTDKRVVDISSLIGFDLPSRRNIGGAIAQTSLGQSFGKRYVVDSYGLGTAVAVEDVEDDEYGVINRWAATTGGEFARKFALMMEINAWNYLATVGYASGSSNATNDGLGLFSTVHPINQRDSGVIWSNRASSDVDLSYVSYKIGSIALRKQKATDNLTFIDNPVAALVVNTDQGYIARQVLELEWEYGTMNRNQNLIKEENVQLIETPYFEVSGATGTNNGWILRGRDHSLMFIVRQALRMRDDYDIGTNSYIFAGTSRYAIGADDARGLWASKGN